MGQIISVSIDLNKIDKRKIKPHQNGAKYYSMTLFVNDDKDRFGNDVSVADSQTKEARESGEPKSYLGNGRVIWQGSSERKAEPADDPSQPTDDLPF